MRKSTLIVTDHANDSCDIEGWHGQNTQEEQTHQIDSQSRGAFFEKDAHSYQEKMSQENEDHMMMPSYPAAQLVMVETDFDLASPENELNRPTHSADAHQYHAYCFAQSFSHPGLMSSQQSFTRPRTLTDELLQTAYIRPKSQRGISHSVVTFLLRVHLKTGIHHEQYFPGKSEVSGKMKIIEEEKIWK